MTGPGVNIVTKCTMITKETRESILKIQVNAALAGHGLGRFEPVEVLGMTRKGAIIKT